MDMGKLEECETGNEYGYSHIEKSTQNSLAQFLMDCMFSTIATILHVCVHHIFGLAHKEITTSTDMQKGEAIYLGLRHGECDMAEITVPEATSSPLKTHGFHQVVADADVEHACGDYGEKHTFALAADTATDPGKWVVSPFTLGRRAEE